MKKFSFMYQIIFALFFFINTFQLFSENYYFKNINTDFGLSSNSINAILRDQKGYLWVGTDYGLNRYDGYNMKVFKQDISNPNSLKNNYVFSLNQDKSGNLWVLTKSGYSVFDYKKELFISDYKSIFQERNIKESYLFNVICGKNITAHVVDNFTAVLYNHITKSTLYVEKRSKSTSYLIGCFDVADNLWLMDSQNYIYKIDSKTGKIIKTYDYLIKSSKISKSTLFLDKSNNLWVTHNNSALYYINTQTDVFYDFRQSYGNAPFNTFPIRSITEDNNKNIWIGTDHGGTSVIDTRTFKSSVILENEKLDYSISENSITALYTDADGIVWVGTYKQGLNFYHPSNRRFNAIKIPGSSNNNDINCFSEDKDGNLLIGTNGKGLFKYNLKTGLINSINYSNYINKDNTIVSLLTDSKNRLWIGTFEDGLYCYDGKKFIHYNTTSNETVLLPENNIWSIIEDASQQIWIGTLNMGLYKFDEPGKKFIRIQNNKSGSTIECALKDNNNDLYFGSSWGLFEINKEGKFNNFFEFNKNNDKIPEKNYINSIAQDKNGYYWIATQSGLAILKDNKYHFFGVDEGFDNKFILMVIVDSNNDIWVSTTTGLYLIKVLDYGNIENIKARVIQFSKDDGLQDNKFNGKSAYFTKDKKIVFGGVSGFNIIDPKTVKLDKNTPNIVLTNLYVNNKLVSIGEQISNRVVLEQALEYSSKIKLRYNENTISIGFSALNFLHPEKNKYEYQLKGFDDKWVTIDAKNPSATYSYLSSGNYTFNVRVKYYGQSDNDKITSLKIEILPPFWLSWYAYIFYLVIIVSLVIFIYRFLVDRATFELRIKQELQERKHIEEISAMKVKFFTNLSHELRTPVSLIMLPIENILAKNVDPTIKNNLTMVLRNAKRLLFIVNQLLDFRKLEVGEITYHPVLGDIVSFIKDVTLPFMDISQNKNIKLTVRSNVEELITSFDPNKLERILFNLLSNAFKFTGNKGTVEVSLQYDESQPLPIIIKISDTGIGIDKHKIDNIFKPFYQADNQGSIADMGTGIGLSITFEFVRLHNGNIKVESEIDKGTTFIIELPMIENNAPDVKEDLPEEELVTQYDNTKSQIIDAIVKKNKTVLIVDDNDDFRFYLVENLRSLYNIIEANTGEIAFEKANRFIPDIIVSDVTMPGMDGYELCEKLRKEVHTSHIPIILLTANIMDNDKIVGFEAGADDYITKPFNVGVLQARIRNLLSKKIEQRNSNNEINSEITDVHLPSLDEKLLEKVIKITNEKMADTEFGVEELSKMIGMSSVYLNKKMSALTGKTTSEYVRSIRLRKAAQLLEKSDLTISEVAYEVGYNSPKYFSKYFKDEFGILPSEYRKSYF
jgi:signal transduction histidine kinase/ligand-binding sensor domain-containing protein/DNA-binding response OmpR family regulator